MGIGTYLALASVLFGIGSAGFLVRRNMLIQLMSIELLPHSVNVLLLAFNRAYPANHDGQIFAFISYPEVAFGIIGAVIALPGMVVARISREMTERFGPNQNFLIISVLALLSFIGIRFFIPHFGVIFAMLLFAAMVMTGFCTSYYLNKTADKSIRATLLSFKGLALNLGYGGIGILYALLVVSLRKDSNLANDSGLLFQAAADWFAPWFAITFIGMLLCNWKLRPKPPA